MSVKVIDVSHWNTLTQFNNHKDAAACMIKFTEGKSYSDPERITWTVRAATEGMLIGAYHYARPDKGNSPKEEADNFISEVYRIIPSFSDKYLLALDWEGKSIGYDTAWLEEWLGVVYEATGIRAFIYTNHEGLKQLAKGGSHLIETYGLWYASPTGEAFRYSHPTAPLGWKVVAMHQYDVVDGIDVNAFNGSLEQLMKYATPDKKSSTAEPDVTEETCTCFMCEDIRRLVREELEMQKQNK